MREDEDEDAAWKQPDPFAGSGLVLGLADDSDDEVKILNPKGKTTSSTKMNDKDGRFVTSNVAEEDDNHAAWARSDPFAGNDIVLGLADDDDDDEGNMFSPKSKTTFRTKTIGKSGRKDGRSRTGGKDLNKLGSDVVSFPSSDSDDESDQSDQSDLQVDLGEVLRRSIPSDFREREDVLRDEDGVRVGTFVCPDLKPSSGLANSISVALPASTLVTPRSMYDGHDSPAPEVSEWKAVTRLLANSQHASSLAHDSVEIELDQFAIYVHARNEDFKPHSQQLYPHDMRPLHQLCTKSLHMLMYVDGVLSCGDTRFFVRKIPFTELPMGNYGTEQPSVGDQIWIRPQLNEKAKHRGRDVFYKLKDPAPEYARFHLGFLWVADFAKHVVDYLAAMGKKKRRVAIKDFKSHFCKWILSHHKSHQVFQTWFKQFNRSDFRNAVSAYRGFIYKEAYDVLGHQRALYHTLWKEIIDYTAYARDGRIFERRMKSTIEESQDSDDDVVTGVRRNRKMAKSGIPPTVVTPYIYETFRNMPFASILEKVAPCAVTERLRQESVRQQHLELSGKLHASPKQMKSVAQARSEGLGREIRVGDVISTPRDDSEEHWIREAATDYDIDRWFALVQRIHSTKSGDHFFDVTWIYRPEDTLCGAMRYPWNDELFLSDHCSCDSRMAKIQEAEVLAIHRVDWGGSSKTTAEFFCRQTYLHQDRRWITFEADHLKCSHRKVAKPDNYRKGDTVLAQLRRHDDTLEPCEVVAPQILESGVDSGVVTIRMFLRRQGVEPTARCRPNELVYSATEPVREVEPSRIWGRCIVRCFGPAEDIPTPYDRDGVGNAFYIRTRLVETSHGKGSCVPFDAENRFPSEIRQGFDPREEFRKLKGFDLFCGGGNFGRGLEETGALEMKWCNDYDARAVHTYMANVDSDDVHPYLGSIDDLQRAVLEGRFAANVPRVGEVDFVSAGSPCPGFSNLTSDKTTAAQRKNQSLVAAFASFVDTYRPKYGVLENVLEIVKRSRKERNEDVFSQLVCALVGLGYQTHFFLLDAWTYGSPQSRSRVFLVFAAPGHRLPEMPAPSHAHLPGDKRTKALGWLPNNESMVDRRFVPTAFKPVTVGEACLDLPDIADAKADCCVPFPDHRQAWGATKNFRAQVATIPVQPYAMSFAKANYHQDQNQQDYHVGAVAKMTEADRALFPAAINKHGNKCMRVQPKSRGWGRVHPGKIVGTVTTTPNPTDAFVGRQLHWNQNRSLTVMEVRRAQGFRDEDVILGEPREQWKTVGNSVAREVSMALGLSFREAWLGSLVKGDEILPARERPVVDPQALSIPIRSAAREVTPDCARLNAAWQTADLDIFGEDGESILRAGWRGSTVLNEDYAPSDSRESSIGVVSDISTSASAGLSRTLASPGVFTPSKTGPSTPATSVTGGYRSGSGSGSGSSMPPSSSRKRKHLETSVIVELFTSKMTKKGVKVAPGRKRARVE